MTAHCRGKMPHLKAKVIWTYKETKTGTKIIAAETDPLFSN